MGREDSGATNKDDDFVAASRDALVTALLAAGPQAPTLCEGWQTQHLAAHIHLRESSPLSVGLVVSPLSRALQAKTMELGEASQSVKEYQRLVKSIASANTESPDQGKPSKNPLRRIGSGAGRRLATLGNLLEFFVHTEDVRRAQRRWAPRKLSTEYADALFTELRHQAKIHYRKFPTGVALVRSNGERIIAKKGNEYTFISGPAGELVLHAFGRDDHSLVLVDQP